MFLLGVVLNRILQFAHQEEGERWRRDVEPPGPETSPRPRDTLEETRVFVPQQALVTL